MYTKPVRKYGILFLRLFFIAAAILTITSDNVIKPIDVKAASIEGSLGTWDLVNSPVSSDLKSVSMVSKSNGWIVGDGGIILHWNGNEWSTVDSPTTQHLYAIKMISATNGWAMGNYGTILHWDGSSWSSAASPTSAILLSMDFVSPTEGWAVGYSTPCTGKRLGTILKWDGSAWSTVLDSINDIGYRTVEALSSDNVWVIGFYQQATCPPTQYHSQILDIAHWDGQLWNDKIESHCNDWINSLALMPDNTGWAGGNICLAAFNNGVMTPVSVGVITDYNLVSINIVAQDDVWAVGVDHMDSSGKSFIVHWNGSTWGPIPNPGSKMLSSVSMISASDGWAVGYAGTILHYTNYIYTYTYLPLAIR
jgi:photosystem II stability/assembly factor-like uncharacterized protein